MSKIPAKIKLIELHDVFIDHKYDYPYIHSIGSHIRFKLRSKMVYNYQPILIIEKNSTYEQSLPLQSIDQYDVNKFDLLRGQIDESGAWWGDLTPNRYSLVTFQLVFLQRNSHHKINSLAQSDVIIITQNKIQLRQLRKMSVFPRCIGTHEQWSHFFIRQNQLGYNAFHLAPIQQTGASQSYYSISNHQELSNDLFNGSSAQKYEQLSSVIGPLKSKGLVFFADIVLNHVSFDCKWITQDSVFTPNNTPILKPAYQVDKLLYEWGEQIRNNLMVSNEQLKEQMVPQLQQSLTQKVTALQISQYFTLAKDVQQQLYSRVKPRKISWNLFQDDPIDRILKYLKKYQDNIGMSRSGITLKNYTEWEQINLEYNIDDLVTALDRYNRQWHNKVQQIWIPQIINHTISQIRNNYISNNYRTLQDGYPFMTRYFSTVHNQKGQSYNAANNGWISNGDSSINFALSQEMYYLRRKVNVWGDLLRLRYGQQPSASPKNWQYMGAYVRKMAKYFDGFRMDNLHGTQINVARYMISQARKVNPSLIVFAQLFTNSDQQTALFTRTIGINSILREAQQILTGKQFVDSLYASLGTNGRYMGSQNNLMVENQQILKYSTRKKPIILAYDMTHDNQTYVEKNLHNLQTPVSLLLSLIGTFVGSTKGYDQFYAQKINVTEKKPLYNQDRVQKVSIDKSQVQKYKIIIDCDDKCVLLGSWDNWKQHKTTSTGGSRYQQVQLQLGAGYYEYKFQCNGKWFLDDKKSINAQGNHDFTLKKGQRSWKYIYSNLQQFRSLTSDYNNKYFSYNQYYAYYEDNIVVMYRQQASHENSICVIVNLSSKDVVMNNCIKLPGCYRSAEVWLQTDFSLYQGFTTSMEIIHHYNLHQYFDWYYHAADRKHYLVSDVIPAGFSCVIQCGKNQQDLAAIRNARQLCSRNIQLPPLGAIDYNHILYGTTSEQEKKYGQSNYVLPKDNKQLVYAGLAGVIKIVKEAKRYNVLSGALFDNLRQGNWLLKYYLQRMKKFKNLQQITNHMEHVFEKMQQLPRYLIPKYFCEFIYNLYAQLQKQIAFQGKSTNNIFKLQLQMAGPQFLTTFHHQKTLFRTLMAAGLPHFSVGWSRCWGRDTFICSELLLQHPNLYREIILQFASTQRHGVIPNLLDSGNNPRYNCRDACWWFVRAVYQYAQKTKDYGIFKEKVNLIFLSNDVSTHHKMQRQAKNNVKLLEDIIHTVFQSHANDVHYRQWGAGYEIDACMQSQGFNIHLQVEDETGFINGGNYWNCLTWMDKMGSSKKALNYGIPATPRAGCPVQLVGLLKYCLDVYEQLHKSNKYSYNSVTFKKRTIRYKEWSMMLQQNFQKQFYIGEQLQQSNRRLKYFGFYQDVVHAQVAFQQIRLRPNALITLALAPQLCDKQHAINYITNVQNHLLRKHSIGVGTLAEKHTSLYAPYYDNNQDGSNIITAHGFSYHNGPQWVWLYGFYIIAKINFQKQQFSASRMMTLLQEHVKYIQNDEWCSLPQMTNYNAQFNNYSCRAQAWSISSLLMAVQKIQTLTNQ